MKFVSLEKSSDGLEHNDWGIIVDDKGTIIAEMFRWQFNRRNKMNEYLYLTSLPSKDGKGVRYVGYVIINMAAVMVMEANDMLDVKAYCVDKGFKGYQWRVPLQEKYKMIRVKEW